MCNEPQSQSRQDDNKMQSRGIKDNKIMPKTREKYAARKEIFSHRGVFFLINWLLHIFIYSLFTQSVEERARFALTVESCVELTEIFGL